MLTRKAPDFVVEIRFSVLKSAWLALWSCWGI